jgi:hypothetical protein
MTGPPRSSSAASMSRASSHTSDELIGVNLDAMGR